MAKFAEFHNTKNLFIESIGYTQPITFEEWCKYPDHTKVAFLFVQFYNAITLAWEKADSREFGDDAEGVSTVLQYLTKQVSQKQYFEKDNPTKKATAEYRRKNPDGFIEVERRLIEEDPSKFSERYIYRIAYNCLYCICGHDRKCDKDRMDNETSAIVTYDGEELNLFDTVADKNGSAESCYESDVFANEFWSVIEDTGLSAEKVMRYLLSQDKADLKKLTKSSKQYDKDPLRNVEVSLDAVDQIIETLREKFLSLPSDSACGRFISQFSVLD